MCLCCRKQSVHAHQSCKRQATISGRAWQGQRCWLVLILNRLLASWLLILLLRWLRVPCGLSPSWGRPTSLISCWQSSPMQGICARRTSWSLLLPAHRPTMPATTVPSSSSSWRQWRAQTACWWTMRPQLRTPSALSRRTALATRTNTSPG